MTYARFELFGIASLILFEFEPGTRRFTMRFSTSSILLAVSTLLGAAVAHNIQLAAHGRECFHEMLHKDDKMTVTFQVGDREFGAAGNLDVDFWVCHLYLFPAFVLSSLLTSE